MQPMLTGFFTMRIRDLLPFIKRSSKSSGDLDYLRGLGTADSGHSTRNFIETITEILRSHGFKRQPDHTDGDTTVVRLVNPYAESTITMTVVAGMLHTVDLNLVSKQETIQTQSLMAQPFKMFGLQHYVVTVAEQETHTPEYSRRFWSDPEIIKRAKMSGISDADIERFRQGK